MSETVLVTGGAGYIGSHCIVDLLNAGYEVVTVDNLCNSRSGALRRVQMITGKKITFYKCDLLNSDSLRTVFAKHKIDYVIHFAAMKSVVESLSIPLDYYKNNVIGTINLIEAMKKHRVYRLVFSSSCTVYGDPQFLPLDESHPTGRRITNVYGKTKYLIEELLKDLTAAEPDWKIITLRYFNPIGAHPSGMLGEDPTQPFRNIMPILGDVAMGKRKFLTIYGDNYDTVDGTGVRDYIHVMDLVHGHVLALPKLKDKNVRFQPYNLGLGNGLSVMQIVREFERVSETEVPHRVEPRRCGDVASLVCNGELAYKELNWKPIRTISDMCKDFWKWQIQNAEGYAMDEPFPPASLSPGVPNGV